MKSTFVCVLLLTPLQAFAGLDKPWQEDNVGGGGLPGASMLFGEIGAGFLVYQGFENNDSVGSIFVGAVLGFSFGSIIGLPIGCMLR